MISALLIFANSELIYCNLLIDNKEKSRVMCHISSIKYINHVCNISVSLRNYVNSTLQDASNKEVAGIAIVVLVLVVSPIIIILMRNAVATIQVCDSNAIDLIPFHATRDSLFHS